MPLVKHCKPNTVKPNQSVKGGKPYIFIAGLENGTDAVLWQSGVGCPLIKPVLSQHWRRGTAPQEKNSHQHDPNPPHQLFQSEGAGKISALRQAGDLIHSRMGTI